jgi:site-specific recombinase XerC
MRDGISPNDDEFNEISIACVDEEFVRQIKTIDILEFMAYTAQARGNSAAARSRKLSAIRMFFKYLTVSEKIINLNPAADIESPKKKKSLRQKPRSFAERISRNIKFLRWNCKAKQFREPWNPTTFS